MSVSPTAPALLETPTPNPPARAGIRLGSVNASLETVIGNERFKLKNDGAQDLGRYDFIKDVERLERITAHLPQVEGYAVLLTNDSGYWKDGATTVDAAFRLPEGRNLTGEPGWGSAAGKGTTAGRERALQLAGYYPLAWHDDAEIAAPPTRFRWLAVYVPARR